MTWVVEIIPYLYCLSCHLSKFAINGLYLFFNDSLSLNKSVLVVGFISIYALFMFQIKWRRITAKLITVNKVICMYCTSDHVRTAYLFFLGLSKCFIDFLNNCKTSLLKFRGDNDFSQIMSTTHETSKWNLPKCIPLRLKWFCASRFIAFLQKMKLIRITVTNPTRCWETPGAQHVRYPS